MEDNERTIIETASATTSPDNANSGSFAYVLFGITFAAMLVLSLIGAGIGSVILGIAAQTADDAPYEEGMPDDMSGYDDFEEFFDQYYDDIVSDDPSADEQEEESTHPSEDATVADALDFDLAPYLGGLEGQVPASAYANTPASVRDFVRQVVSCDSDYAQRVARSLDAAARDSKDTFGKLAEVRGICDEAKAALDALEVPELEDVEDTSVRDLLGSAKGEAAHRFELISEEIDVLQDGDPVDTKRLWERDDAVVESLDKAASLIEEAMEASRAH